MKSGPGSRRSSGVVLASTAALLLAGGAPRLSHARHLRRGTSSATADSTADGATVAGATEEGFQLVSSNDSHMLHEDDGFDVVGGPIERGPLHDDGWSRTLLQEDDEEEEEGRDEPKEYKNLNELAFVDPKELSERERFEKSCGSNEKLWTFKFRTDRYGYETSWKLELQRNGEWETITSGPPTDQKYHDDTVYMGTTCLKGGQMYKLTVMDAYKDGFCCSFGRGYYTYSVDDVVEYDSNRKRTFLDKGEHTFYLGLPLPGNNGMSVGSGNSNGRGDNPFFTGRAGLCGANKQEIKVKIKTDRYGAENSWELRSVDTDEVLAGKPLDHYGNGSEDEVAVCVPHGMYKFTMTDGIGDGICCKAGEGRYELYMDDELMVYGSDFNYGKRVEHTIVAGYWTNYDGLSQREVQYLECHNWRRNKYHNAFGAEYVPLKYDLSLARDAMTWANELLGDCNVNGIKHEPGVEQGENLAKNTGSGKWGQLYPVENICRRWFEREETWDWPDNAHLTQGLWRSARYVGCAESEKTMPGGGKCRIQVCRYARAGNCNMGAYDAEVGENWKTPMLMDHNPCGPICPPNGCH